MKACRAERTQLILRGSLKVVVGGGGDVCTRPEIKLARNAGAGGPCSK